MCRSLRPDPLDNRKVDQLLVGKEECSWHQAHLHSDGQKFSKAAAGMSLGPGRYGYSDAACSVKLLDALLRSQRGMH